MQRYPVRASHRPNLASAKMAEGVRQAFGEAAQEGERVTTRFGAISRLAVWSEGKELAVELTMDPKVPEPVARETIARYNRFLEELTGYSSKERAKRIRKSASG